MNNKKKLALIVGLGFSLPVLSDSGLTGNWQIANMDQASKDTAVAIEGVVKEMNFFVRGIARSRLEEEAQVCPEWRIKRSEQSFSWQCEDGAMWTVDTQGGPALKGDDGRDIRATFTQLGDSVSVTLRSERGVRTHQWLRQADGVMYRSILESEKLPKPLEWSLQYR